MTKPITLLVRLKNYFIAGLLIVAPIVLTIYVLIWSFNALDGILGPYITNLIGRKIPGIGLILGLLITFTAGFLTSGWLAKRIMKWGDSQVSKLPLIRPLYGTLKQLTGALLSGSDKNFFKRVVLLEYPRKGIWSIGFVTSDDTGGLGKEASDRCHKKLVSVFVVSAPNPTTGWLALVPEDELVTLDVSVEQALKLVVSGGYIRPEDK
jgi:uncharacterized membrane protein